MGCHFVEWRRDEKDGPEPKLAVVGPRWLSMRAVAERLAVLCKLEKPELGKHRKLALLPTELAGQQNSLAVEMELVVGSWREQDFVGSPLGLPVADTVLMLAVVGTVLVLALVVGVLVAHSEVEQQQLGCSRQEVEIAAGLAVGS